MTTTTQTTEEEVVLTVSKNKNFEYALITSTLCATFTSLGVIYHIIKQLNK